jgi:serine/threonine protein kinase
MAALRHPNIAQVYDLDVIEGRPYIVMELLEGTSLGTYLEGLHASGRILPPETTARLIVALASALEYAHTQAIIHRDVKPYNVMLRWTGGTLDPADPLPLDAEPVLIDFGIARWMMSATQTAPGTFIGTPAYMSPEQIRGDPSDARSDIYALGVMLYEMLAGRRPFVGGTEHSPAAMLIEHLTAEPPPLSAANAVVQAVVSRALHKDPAHRYQRVGDLASDLLVGIFRANSGVSSRSSLAPDLPQIGAMLDRLEILSEQARAYERVLPPNNYAARAAVAALAELAWQALAEARDLADSLKPLPPAPHPFSPREMEVLILAAEGLTNKEIAYRLGVSDRTIQFHMNSIFNKTGTSSRTEAVMTAAAHAWITPRR